MIREARENKEDLIVLCLDITNAYGSTPHKLIEEALIHYHIPGKFTNLILEYNSSFSLKVSNMTTTSAWHKLKKGIITGTISVILFSLAMNMLVKAAEVECRVLIWARMTFKSSKSRSLVVKRGKNL